MTAQPSQTNITDTLNRISTHGLTAATAALNGMELIDTAENSVTIGKSTAVETVIVRTPGGGIKPSNQFAGILPLIRPDYHSSTRFHSIVKAMKRRATDAVLRDLIIHLQVQPEDNDADSPQQQALNDPNTKRKLTSTVAKALKHRFSTAQATTLVDQAYQVLHDFIGQETLAETTAILGQAATVQDLSTFLKHQHKLRAAARKEPNATILWATVQPSNVRIPLPCNAEELIDKARNVFDYNCSHTIQTSTQKELDELWHIFTKLDTHALGKTKHRTVHNFTTLCKHIAAANVQPSAEAALHLLDNPELLQGSHPLALKLYIRASTQAPPAYQDGLVTQLQAIRQYHRLHHPRPRAGPFDPRPLMQALSEKNTDPPSNWTDLVKLLPPWVQDPATAAQTRKLLPNAKYPLLNHPTADHAANSPLGDDLRLISEESLSVHIVPGRTAALFTTKPQRPILLVTKEEDGVIRMGPRTRKILDTTNTLEGKGQQILSPNTARFMYNSARMLAGIRNNLIATNTCNEISPRWREVTGYPCTKYSGFPHEIQLVIDKAIHRTLKDAVTPEEIAKTLSEAVQAMVDPVTWGRGNPTGVAKAAISPFAYNAAATLGTQLDDLVRTNPGAVTWVLSTEDTDERINHPGQIITIAKRSLQKGGLNGSAWKFTAALDTKHMCVLTDTRHASKTTQILNTLAQANVTPSPSVLYHITTLWPTNTSRTPQDQLTRENTALLVRLLAKESQRLTEMDPPDHDQSELRSLSMDVKDYVKHASSQGEHVHSTTWQGLVKQSDHWHKGIKRESANNRWQQALATRRGAYLAWDSILETESIGQYVVRALSNEKMLHEESARMDHCVYSYTDRCASGHSRIFSISKNGTPIATTELRADGTTWRAAQTRAKDNHPAPPEVQSAANLTALIYTRKCGERETPEHRAWTIHDPNAKLELETP